MNFPEQLLPNIERKIIDCDTSEYVLVRFVELKDGLELINELENIELKYIADPTKHISDYSTNLLGVFEINHIAISLTDLGKQKYNLYCLPNETVTTPEYEAEFYLNNERKYFSLKIGEIDNFTFPYEIDKVTYTGKCIVEHTPMKWNFWHFSIRWQNQDNIYLDSLNDKEIKKGWGRQLSSVARALLSQFAKLSIPDNYQIIPTACYVA